MVSVAEMQQLQAELAARDQITALATAQEDLKRDAQNAIAASESRANNLARQLVQQNMAAGGGEKLELVDFKVNKPEPFYGRRDESWKAWSKQFKTYCIVRKDGMKKALDWAEAQQGTIDAEAISSMGWPAGDLANSRFYDFLFLQCKGDAHVLIERHDGMGFEAWRQLAKRYSPSGGQFEIDMMNRLMNPQKAGKLSDLPAAILRFERDIETYQVKTGRQFPEEWKTPTFLRILPDSHRDELVRRFQMGQRDYGTLVDSVRGFSEEAWFNLKSPNDMDIDAAGTESQNTSESDYKSYTGNSDDESVDWMGKGKGKGKGKNWNSSASQRSSSQPTRATTTTTTTSASTKSERRGVCHHCGGDDHYIRDRKAKKAGKPRTYKNGQPIKSVDEDGGDYEEQLLGSVSMGVCSLDICEPYRGAHRLCVSERSLCRTDGCGDHECMDPFDNASREAASHPTDEAGGSRNAFQEGDIQHQPVYMFDLDGPDVVYTGTHDYEATDDIDMNTSTGIACSAWDSDIMSKMQSYDSIASKTGSTSQSAKVGFEMFESSGFKDSQLGDSRKDSLMFSSKDMQLGQFTSSKIAQIDTSKDANGLKIDRFSKSLPLDIYKDAESVQDERFMNSKTMQDAGNRSMEEDAMRGDEIGRAHV